MSPFFLVVIGLTFCEQPVVANSLLADKRAANQPLVVVSEAARKVHAAGFVFDGHNDLPWELREKAGGSFDKADIAVGVPKFHTDIPRLRAGNVGAQFWAAYVPAETSQERRSFAMTLEQIEIIRTMVRRYPDVFEFAKTADDVLRIQKSGKIASLIGVEGGHSIEDSLDKLRRLRELGVNYMTLTHSDTLSWADSATDEAKHNGLTKFGKEIVLEMNRLGMLVDLSHVSPATMREALATTKAPIIFSHSSARAIADHPRNVPDEILTLTKKNGGVVMVNFFSGFIHPESAKRRANMFQVSRDLRKQFPNEADYQKARKRWEAENPIEAGTVQDVVDHIDHIVKIAGIDHVGLGSDFDGIPKTPRQLNDVSMYPVITQEMLNRGYNADQIHQVMSGNILRVLRRSEEVARDLAR
jgi:membrane dipeptidase